MLYVERDIDFTIIKDGKMFEELCFDLLIRLGFKRLKWCQGGSDNGRDMEGYLGNSNALIGSYDEKWFFECKHHSKGINPEAIFSKIAWADSGRPKHFALFTSTYITTPTETWFEGIKSQGKFYKMSIIEGKQLKQLILMFPDLIKKYFISESQKLLHETEINWVVRNILPSIDTLYYLYKNIDYKILEENDLVFLVIMKLHQYSV